MKSVQAIDECAFSFLRVNERQQKPRTEGITEIRGISLWITVRLSSWNACGRASGERRASGDG
jgi:hypothetical protein